MNKKTFTVAVIFLIVTLVWLGVNIFWALSNSNCIFDLVVAVLFVLAGVGMVYNECHKRKRKHLDEVNKYKIMSVFFFVCGVVSLWRILSDDGRDIWYVPLVLIGASGILAVRARSMGRKNTQNED